MNENIENNDWMNEAPALAALEKRNPFSVPDGYFENSDEAIFSAVFLDGLKQKTSDDNFEVPQHYFDNLAERIQTQIVLSEMPKAEKAFAVPENYFDTLQSRIADKIATTSEPRKEAKVIPLWRRNIVKYVSAACFLLMASYGIYFYQNGSVSVAQPSSSAEAIVNEQLLYDIDENTIIDHLETQNTTSSNIKTTSASDTEMENYILSNFSSSDLAQELNN
ncbi:hypothetical protein SAMN05421827_11380 [Pedobacter terrae]|uniref:Uncharacterized protein n=1 Tax=Pedobacter terrae TaxID=405671 RepID=A0A1G7YCW3_9SPHI|nr:hypothetical protein [Pedobacter terrae]SDG94166.1 hypothetical protein SAMN05421827_11380 [Pedobacter terrae]